MVDSYNFFRTHKLSCLTRFHYNFKQSRVFVNTNSLELSRYSSTESLTLKKLIYLSNMH